MEENNEKIVQNNVKEEVNSNIHNQKKKSGITIVLVIIVLILMLAVGIGIGYVLSDKKIFNNTTENTTPTQENKQEQVEKSQDKSKQNMKVTNVIANQIDYKYMIVEGKDSNENTIWEYTTPEENHPMNIVNEGQKLIEIRNGKVYLCDWGKLYILDEQTGNVLSKNTEANIGAAGAHVFGDNENLYVISYLSYLNKFDENGNLLSQTGELWDDGYTQPNKISIEGDNLIVDFGEQGCVTVNKNTLKIRKDTNNSQANITQNQTNTNNEHDIAVTEIKKCLKDENWLKEKEIADGLNLSLKLEKIQEEEKYDGYYSIVTSELEMSNYELRNQYRGLAKIEDTFKISKYELNARPVLVWT